VVPKQVVAIRKQRRHALTALRAFSLALVLVVGLVVNLSAASTPSQASVPQVIEFQSMTPVTGPYVGATNPIRGINGGGLPWMIASGRGELSSTGHLEVSVRGLVLAASAPVPPALQGTNPVPNFRAVVSCASIDAQGNATTVNVSTGLFPASATGKANIEANVMLPHPCIAPVIFVTSPTGAWFAATGR
jgi:hypothetical protein